MEKRKLGEILRFYRNIQQVSQEKLCKGLCSVSTISRIEQGEIDTPMLLAQALMERLGADVSKFELILDNADYHYYVQRQKVEQALRQKKITQAKLTILKYKSLQEKEFPEKNKFLQEQQAREYLIEQEHLTEQAERLLQEAGRYTIPDEEDILLSRIAIDILMTKVQKEHMENLKKVRNFVRDYYSMELREKTYPAIQMKIAKLLAEQGRLEEAVTEIAEGMAVINEGESYQYCAELHFLYAQILWKQWKGKREWEEMRSECMRHCRQAYYLFAFDNDERKEEVKNWGYIVQGI